MRLLESWIVEFIHSDSEAWLYRSIQTCSPSRCLESIDQGLSTASRPSFVSSAADVYDGWVSKCRTSLNMLASPCSS
jgi:hypothetical protein